MTQAVLVVNTHSRKGAELFREAKGLIENQGIKLIAELPVKKPQQIRSVIEQALELKPDLLIVGSGDGTVSEIVDYLAYSKVVLGVIPLGTTNNFARSLGVPLDLKAAIELLSEGKVAAIDLGKVNDDYFANVASIGISVEVARRVSKRLKKRLGRAAYALSAAKSITAHKSFDVVIETADRTIKSRTHQIIIANGSSHSGRPIANDASIDSSQLTIIQVGNEKRRHLVGKTWRFIRGKKRTLAENNYLSANEATITTSPIRTVEIDGELKTRTPITVSVAKNALKVMVPLDFDDM